MNVIRANVSDRNRECVSPNAAEPVGIMPRNYSVLHLATAKRPNVSSDYTTGVSSGPFSMPSNAILSKISGRGRNTSGARQMQNVRYSSSSVIPGSSSGNSGDFWKYFADQISSNKPTTSTSKSSSSLNEAYPHLFRNMNKITPASKTPKETPRKTPKASTRTSSRTPKTLKTTTSDSFEKDSHTLVAISEGRGQARGEIGIAALDVSCPHLILCQISDTQTYSNTLIKVNVLNPVEVVLPHTFCEGTNISKLYASIQETFPSVSLTLVHRRHFNDGKGLQIIKNVCANEYASVELLVSHKFYALCAAAALIRYVEYKQSTIFLPKSLKIEYQGPHNSTVIDVDSAHRLELAKSCTGTVAQHCLFGVLNRCRTNGGIRLLRANILEPPCSLQTIMYRLECVQELISKPEILHSLQNILVKVSYADRLLTLCMHAPQQDTLRAAEQQMNYVLLLKTTLEQIPILSVALENAESEFLCTVREDLQNVYFETIRKRISETIQDDAHMAKNYVTAQYQRCFAVKPGINGLLDVARKTYSELIEDMIEMVQKIGESCGLPVILKFNALRGFHMQLIYSNKRLYKESDLPSKFIQVQKRRNSLTFTTQELIHADERCSDVRNEIQMMSNVVIFKLLVDIRDHIGCLYKLCENIAYLDMLVSFARASALPNFVMPKFGDTLDVKGSHHPILEFINPSEPVANDIFSSVHSNVHIITGPNMSGKSIYIRQVVLLQIMAQIGCYVPAVDATFRISDRIFTRIGFDDSIECNASTFVLEIREVQYILQTMTPSSLIIMDELCRGTSSEEGTAVAWTLCESLLQSDAFIFLTTHFMLLTKLESIYTNVKNYHFGILEQEDNPNQFFYSHRLLPGPSQSNNYGIHLAEILGMPESIAKQARELSENIFSQEQPTIETNGNINDDRLYLELHCELLNILKQGPLSKKACLDLKYRLFPSVTTSDELIEIGEIIPCSSNREDLPITPTTSQKNIPIDDMTAQDILPSLLCNTLRKENVEVTKGESCKNFVDNEYNFSHVSFQCGNIERDAGGTLRNVGENIEELNADNDYNFSKGFQYDNIEGTENSFREENIEEMNEGSNSDNEYNFTNAGFEFDNVKDLEAHIESNDFFQFPLEDRSDSNERTILDVLNDLTEEN